MPTGTLSDLEFPKRGVVLPCRRYHPSLPIEPNFFFTRRASNQRSNANTGGFAFPFPFASSRNPII